MLALLLLRAGRVVPFDELIDAVWEDRPPATARAQLQICVSRLRQRLAVLGLPPDVIVTDPAGYGIRVAPDDLDADIFGRAVDAARAAVAAGQSEEARRHYRAALALWRGPALSGIPSRSVRRRALALDEQRLAALEERVEIELRLRPATDLVDELVESVERNPLRERLRGQLMRALAAVGRQADALAVYREGRRLYAEELGIEPGPELQDLHQRVLAGDLALGVAEHRSTVPVRSLPRAISDFTGRQQTVVRLVKEIEEDRVRVQLIDGMAGSGKTTLAVHLAAALGDRYPDAHLFVDLHGHSERMPLTPAAAVAVLLRQLGVPPERMPLDLADRLTLWRTELAGRRALVVLDNAADSAQVTPLLPNGPDCLVLITSRGRLVGLDEGRPSSLPVLDPEEAVELLGRIVGRDRVAAEPEAAAEVARRCGHLPLALRLAAARLAHRPRWRVADLAERLATSRDPLAELAAGERSVGQAFALSYAQVSPTAQRMLRLLGLPPGGGFDNRVAAALADIPLAEAQDLLDELVDAHLVEEADPGRYRLHDLIREYARTLLAEPGRAGERRAALERLLDHHLDVASAISRTIESAGSLRSLPANPPRRPDLVDATLPQGRAWFDAHAALLTALVQLAEVEGFRRHCWQLARACWRANFDSGHLDDLLETHTVGLRAAEALGDEAAVGTIYNYLSSVYYRQARFPEAIRLMRRALEIRRRLGLRDEMRVSLWNLGVSYSANGDHQQGMECLDTAMQMIRGADHTAELANLINNVAYALLSAGRHAEALRLSRSHLVLARQNGDFRQLANAVAHTGMIRHRMGHLEPAQRLLRVALRLKKKYVGRYGEAEVLNEMGTLQRRVGRPERAADLHREALVVVTDSGDRIGQCASRNLLAQALLDQGDVASALDLHRRVLADATRLGARYEQARALDGLARCLRDTDAGQARRYAGRALVLFRQIESPGQRATEELLAELG